MKPDFVGEYLLFQLDWETGEIHLEKSSPTFQHISQEAMPITPLAQALFDLARQSIPAQSMPAPDMPEQDSAIQHCLIDAQYSGNQILLRLHRVRNYASVVEVPRERLQNLLVHLLTPREIEIATLLFEGRTIRYIASELTIAEGTVKRIIYNVYQKLNVSSQVELVREIYARLAQFGQTACSSGCPLMLNRPAEPCGQSNAQYSQST